MNVNSCIVGYLVFLLNSCLLDPMFCNWWRIRDFI